MTVQHDPHSGAPFVQLHAPDSATTRVYLDGAQVSSWHPAGVPSNEMHDRLFVSANAVSGPGKSLRGGIPICFPQFGPYGALPQHGFARNARWLLTDDQRVNDGLLVLSLTDRDLDAPHLAAARNLWPHAFAADLHVAVGGDTLSVTLAVQNTGHTPFTFTAALHPYFRVQSAAVTAVHGLTGLTYRDALQGGAEVVEQEALVPFPGNIDRVYYNAPDVLELREPHRALRIEKHGFPDAVVWNPGLEGTGSRADFVPGDEHIMVCVEAGAIRTPITLAPGAQWAGSQIMTAV